jgi:hypothetical protein
MDGAMPPRTHGRALLPVTVLVWAALPGGTVHARGGARAHVRPECTAGRFVVTGVPLLAGVDEPSPRHTGEQGESHGGAVTVLDGRVSIDGICPPSGRVQIAHRRKRTRILARWRRCPGVRGAVRLRLDVDAATCQTVRGTFRARRAGIRVRRFTALRSRGNPEDCTGEPTFAVVQERVFGPRGCRVQTCHGADAAGGLDLQAGAAWEGLVGVPAANPIAAAAGAVRVVPGDPDASFLVRKLVGPLAAGEGDPMPVVGTRPDPLEIDLVRAWIAAGAPKGTEVPGAPCLPPSVFEPAPALPPPAGGYQLVLEGPMLQPGEEQEGCMWVPVPNDGDFVVGRWEYSLNPGTHHFAVWEHERGDVPEPWIWRAGDIACGSGGARFGISISGAPEAPYFVDAYTPGTGKIVRGGTYLGLNAHYDNTFDVPVPIRVWINLHPVTGALEHVLDSLLSQNASLGGRSTYSINVPPHTQQSLRVRWTNDLGGTIHITQLGSHMHQRGIRFTAWASDGHQLYANADWAHPTVRNFAPPIVLAAGDYIEYECVQDNGVERKLRRCGDSPYDRSCAPGEPIPVTFGVSAEDEMCFLTGLYYFE